MKPLLTPLLFLFLSASSAYGQYMFPTKLDKCDAGFFQLEGTEIYAQKDITILLTEILNSIEPANLQAIRGVIRIQVYIDTLGNACCISAEDELNKAGRKTKIPEIINNSTTWSPPVDEGKKTPVCTIIRLEFTSDKVIIHRQGFNAKRGGIILLARAEQRK